MGNNPQKIQIYGAVLSLYVTRLVKLVNSRVGKGISARAAHGTVREALTSYGSCYLTLFNSKLPVVEQRW
ncbi:MAG: hypothetical protein JWQ96_2025, partial [Segetibacter sp.]|nr:hypothetical protein [Segetibacter sp.]